MALAKRKTETIPLYTEAEYLTLEREAEERHEYLDGIILAMAGEKPAHGDISVNLVRLISTALLGKECNTYTKDTKVRSGSVSKDRADKKALYSYPDLVVVCGERKYLDDYQDVLTNPTVIIEVLSDSTEGFDRQQKFLRYQQYLPSLVDYILVWQYQPVIEILHRPSPKSPQWEYTLIRGLKSRLRIPSLKCSLRLSDVYYRVTFPPIDEVTGRPLKDPAKAAKKQKKPAKAAKKRATPTRNKT